MNNTQNQNIKNDDTNINKEPKKGWLAFKLLIFLTVPILIFMVRDKLPEIENLVSLKSFYWTIISLALIFILVLFFENDRNIKLAKLFIFLWTLFIITFVSSHLATLVKGISLNTQGTNTQPPGELFWNLLMMTSLFGILGSCLNNLRLVVKHENKSSFLPENLPSYIYRPLIGSLVGVISFLLFTLTDVAQFEFSKNLAEWAHIKPYAIVSFISIIAGFGAEKFLEGFSDIAKFIIHKFVDTIKVIFGQNSQINSTKEQNSIEIAKNMIIEGIATDLIIKLTGITKEDIEKLRPSSQVKP